MKRHYVNHGWLAEWTPVNKLQLNRNQHTKYSFMKNNLKIFKKNTVSSSKGRITNHQNFRICPAAFSHFLNDNWGLFQYLNFKYVILKQNLTIDPPVLFKYSVRKCSSLCQYTNRYRTEQKVRCVFTGYYEYQWVHITIWIRSWGLTRANKMSHILAW